jgi:hypothetical protein
VPIPLTLGVPDRHPERSLPARPLTSRLLLPRRTAAAIGADLDAVLRPLLGSPVIPLAEIGADAQSSGAIAALDLREHDIGRKLPTGVELHLDCPPDLLDAVLALQVRATIFVTGSIDAETVRMITAAGRRPGLDLAAPAAEVADFLAVLAHTDTGFVARAATGAEALAGIAATVAALRGDDVRAAFLQPDIAALARINQDAAAAVREVLIGIEVTDPAGVARELAALS